MWLSPAKTTCRCSAASKGSYLHVEPMGSGGSEMADPCAAVHC
jgi:hypothetical protein